MPDRVTRRAVLASAGTLPFGGCLGDTGSAGGPPAVSFGAEVRRSFADEHPAELRLGLANGEDEPLVVRWNVSGGQGGPFNPVWGVRRGGDAEVGVFRRDGSAALCVPGSGSPVPEHPVDGCWTPPCEEVDLPASLHGRFELVPDEPIADEYVLLDGPGGTCLEPGTYEFGGTRTNVDARVARGTVEDASVETRSGWYPLERRLTVSIDEEGTVTASAEAVVASPGTPADDRGSTPRRTPEPVDGANPGRRG